ncbi:MAG: ParB N-terminal domain-containing protein, partial [Oscillospiraceae bacterium]|nr:ParB N-terminal domain-containing protein [Oscillospiraceae bacterium]
AIHDLPGKHYPKQPPSAYSTLVSSLIVNDMNDPLILRQREDEEFELVDGYRRHRAAMLAKLKDVPALIYDMSIEEALDYAARHKTQKDMPVPGKLLSADELQKGKKPVKEKGKDKTAPTGKKADDSKAKKTKETKANTKEKSEKQEEPAAIGPSGTGITKVLDSRLTAPSEKDMKSLPLPEGNEAFSVVLHPGYLEKAEYNNFSVDRESDDFKELYKSIENFGVREPVIATPGEDGKLQIVSGQRRHLIAVELNYPVPTIIQRLDPDDARILVADSNLHREKISSYDLSRALRMKADSMKKKVGRHKLDDNSTKGVDTNAELAKEMGMSPAKFNRLLKLSEATKEICNLVDDGTIPITVAYNVAFLDQTEQNKVAHLVDLGYKLNNENTNSLKTIAKTETLTEEKMRDILDGEYPPKKTVEPVTEPVAAEKATDASSGTNPAAEMTESRTEPIKDTTADSLPVTVKISDKPETKPEKITAASDAERPATQKPEDPEHITEVPTKGADSELKVILRGERLKQYFPDNSMTPREVEDSIYSALEERRQRQERLRKKAELFKDHGDR